MPTARAMLLNRPSHLSTKSAALGANVRCKTPSEPWWMIASCCSRRLQHLHHVGAISNGPCAAQSSAWTVGSFRAFVVRHRRRCLSLL